jgi:hypothetical protein
MNCGVSLEFHYHKFSLHCVYVHMPRKEVCVEYCYIFHLRSLRIVFHVDLDMPSCSTRARDDDRKG